MKRVRRVLREEDKKFIIENYMILSVKSMAEFLNHKESTVNTFIASKDIRFFHEEKYAKHEDVKNNDFMLGTCNYTYESLSPLEKKIYDELETKTKIA